MGCGMSTEDKQGRQRNEEIENQLKRDKLNQRNEIKMLLLGKCSASIYRAVEISDSRVRCGRVWKVHDSQADEADPRGWLYQRRM